MTSPRKPPAHFGPPVTVGPSPITAGQFVAPIAFFRAEFVPLVCIDTGATDNVALYKFWFQRPPIGPDGKRMPGPFIAEYAELPFSQIAWAHRQRSPLSNLAWTIGGMLVLCAFVFNLSSMIQAALIAGAILFVTTGILRLRRTGRLTFYAARRELALQFPPAGAPARAAFDVAWAKYREFLEHLPPDRTDPEEGWADQSTQGWDQSR